MSLRSFLASLFRRSPSPGPRRADALAFEAGWANLLAKLGLPPSALRDVLEADSLHPHFHYRHFTKPKRGGRREIAAPDVKLKRLQHEIIARYFANQQPHPAALAYRRGKSTADHVWAHAGADVLITADIKDFFPTTREWRVENWWRERVEEDLARLLTLLTTERGGLPQGAPTSPALSNFVNRELDVRLSQRAYAVGARYTRYCDDLAFSWRGTEPPSDFETGVRTMLLEFGYTLHAEKGWRVQYRRDEPELVGVILTRRGRVRLPDAMHETMRALEQSDDPRDAERLAGYEGYEAMIVCPPGRRRARRK
jgi:RNA-directed DNA polymerase